MKTRLLLALLACVPCWWAPGQAASLPAPATGATVDESRVEKTFYVDPANGEASDDDKHGSAEAPFATLRYGCLAAARAKDDNQGVKLILANGTYREAAEVPPAAGNGKDTDAPLIIEAAENDQAIIDGADIEGWTPSTWKVEDGRWTHPWPFVLANSRPVKAQTVKRERSPAGLRLAEGPSPNFGGLFFVNDQPLRRVQAEADLTPGSFWIGGNRPAPGVRVVALPPEDTTLEDSIMQTGVRPHGLAINGRRGVVVRGLVFQHCSAPGSVTRDASGLNLSGCTDVLVEDVLCQWNDGAGILAPSGTNVTLRRARLLHNGGTGLEATGARNLLAEDCEVSFNGFRSGWSTDAYGKVYFASLAAEGEGVTWRRLHCMGNLVRAVSLSGAHLTLEDSVITSNSYNGLCASGPGPLLVRRCTITGTKASGDARFASHDGGLALNSVADATLQSNVLVNNSGAQLLMSYSPYPTKARPERHTYRHNVFAGTDAGQFLWKMQDADGSKAATDFRTVDTDENCFWNPASETSFGVLPRSDLFTRSSRPSKGAAADQPDMVLDRWRDWLATRGNSSAEAHSLWQDPGFVDLANGDFRLKERSPLMNWDLPSEDRSAGQ